MIRESGRMLGGPNLGGLFSSMRCPISCGELYVQYVGALVALSDKKNLGKQGRARDRYRGVRATLITYVVPELLDSFYTLADTLCGAEFLTYLQGHAASVAGCEFCENVVGLCSASILLCLVYSMRVNIDCKTLFKHAMFLWGVFWAVLSNVRCSVTRQLIFDRPCREPQEPCRSLY